MYAKKVTEVFKMTNLLIEAEKLERLDLLFPSLHVNMYIKYISTHTYQFKQIPYNLYKIYMGDHYFRLIHKNLS